MHNKRGISPLIATVLLLAFAVALGTIAVSYLLDFASPDPCDDIKVSVQSACYSADTVSLIVENTGDDPISSVQVRFVNANKDIKESQLALALPGGSAAPVSVPYSTLNPAAVTITVTPKTLVENKEKFCSDHQASVKLGIC